MPPSEDDGVAGHGGETSQEAGEVWAASPSAVWVAGCHGLGDGGGDGVGARWGCLVGVAQRRPCPAEMPDEGGAEHADQHMGPDAVLEVVVNGP